MSFNLQTLSQEQFSLVEEISEEYKSGFLSLNSLPSQTVTFYGGAKIQSGTKTYTQVQHLAQEFAKLGWGVVSGGGPGVMAASLQGAQKGGGKSAAFRVKIEGEPPVVSNPDVNLLFRHFSVRKYMLRQSDVFIYAPGGLGTLDELMENLTLMKTNKYPKKPIFLLDSSFWQGYIEWFQKILLEERGVVSQDFLDLFKVVDDSQQVFEILEG
jgi:hypothetical protein